MSTTHPSCTSVAQTPAPCRGVGADPALGLVEVDLSQFKAPWRPLAAAVLHTLRSSGKWAVWSTPGSALSHFTSLEEACAAHERGDARCYQVVAELAALGARRGGDDDDAALAVVLMLARGIDKLATRLLRDVCEIDHVNTAVLEEVKAAEPQLGARAAQYLLQRARQRLCRPASGMVSRVESISLEHYTEPATSGGHDWSIDLADPQVEDPLEDLVDLLAWATGVGVIDAAEVDLLIELLAEENAGLAREEAQRVVGERHGVAMRTVRRRRDATTARLRDAAPAYLAAIA